VPYSGSRRPDRLVVGRAEAPEIQVLALVGSACRGGMVETFKAAHVVRMATLTVAMPVISIPPSEIGVTVGWLPAQTSSGPGSKRQGRHRRAPRRAM
jgi:hypothetical protein